MPEFAKWAIFVQTFVTEHFAGSDFYREWHK